MDPAPRPRFVVVYKDRRLPLPDGEFVVGRGLSCHIRFNAPEVSRQHLKLVVRGGRLIAESLSSTTGTTLNGRKMTGTMSLSHGDVLVLGPRKVRIEVEDVAGAQAPRADEYGDADFDPDEQTMPGVMGQEPSGAVPAINYHTCPKCRTRVDFADSKCDACGYLWSPSHPSAVTGRDTLRGFGPPPLENAPLVAEVPVVYASDELSVDAVVTDLDPGRAFVPSPLLDPNGTECELTLLPDGAHAMTVRGKVASVKSVPDAAGPAGMIVRFTDVPAGVKLWIDRWVEARKK